ncbi:MAG: TetR/AcrR family transcriptional regulator [Prevotella sp.]|jgi:AcrR family transcriptional regulator|nr:TetR/AcrR family transcriptional regulator [Prevotella sp.]
MNTYKKDTKQHIIETAFLLFMDKSYKAVTLKDIIRETGLSAGAFYHHFESKEQLFKEIIDRYLFSMAGGIYAYCPKNSLWDFIQDTLSDMDKLSEQLGKHLMNEGGMNYLTLMFEAFKLFPEAQKKIIDLHKLEFASWVDIIDIAKSKGEIKSTVPTELLARMFIYLPDGSYMNFLIDRNMDKYRFGARKLWEGLYDMLKK